MYRIFIALFAALLPLCAFCDDTSPQVASITYVNRQIEDQAHTTADQNIDGVKTYTQSPIVPTPPAP